MSKKILIISPSWIGDCVMTQPLYQRLLEVNPHAHIDVFAPKWSMAVFERMPEIRHVFENPFGHGALDLKKRWQVGRELAQHQYDQVIVLPNSLKSAIVAFATQAKQRTGYVGEMRYGLLNDARRLDKTALPLMVDRYTALADVPNAFQGKSTNPRLSIDSEQQNQTLQAYSLHRQQPILALCTGAEYGAAKRWLPEHFAKTAQHYHQLGWQVWLFGSHKDFETAEQVNELSGNLCVNLCGKTTLAEAIDLLACADLVVCNDSGLMHLAAAVGCKVVAVYGSSSPTHTPPLSPMARIASLHLECSPCFKRECPLGHTDCLRKLLPEQVIELHQELLN